MTFAIKKQSNNNTTTGSSSGHHHLPSTTSVGKPRRRKTINGSNSKEGVEGRKNKKQRNVSSRDVKEKRRNEEVELPKDYIHVRARRGQATDSHSLAERVRREQISERMNKLQNLIPGCDQVTGKTLMLDEIINYVQSLQNQVELLSMKLASINPVVYDLSLDRDGLIHRPKMGMPIQPTLFPSLLLDDSIITTQAQLQEEGEKFVVDRSGLSSNNFCSFS